MAERNAKGQYLKGHTTPKEVRNKMSKKRAGIKFSEERSFKCGNVWRGKKRPPFSEEWRRNISLAKMGNKCNLGKHRTEESKKRMSLAHIGYIPSEETRKKISEKSKGRKHTEEARLRMSFLAKQRVLEGRSNLYKGGISKVNELIRKGTEFKLWREAVYKNNNYTCQKCGVVGRKLHPHHIQSFAYYPELRLVISNGITLCVKDHREFHKRYGYNNNRGQIEEFLSDFNIPHWPNLKELLA